MNMRTLILGFLSAFALFTCDNELNVTDVPATIPVVYALIDGNDSINYIRVERGFIDEVLSGETIAQIPDSLYFGPEVLVRITNMRTNTAVALERVDLADEGFTREEGTFATQPNIAYKLNTADLGLELNDMIRLELIGADDSTILTDGETMVIGEYTLPTSQPTSPINFREGFNTSFGLRSEEQAARFYDLRLFINYTEENIQTGTNENITLEWVVQTNKVRETSSGAFRTATVFQFEGQEFFRFLGNNIDENPNVSRTFNSINLQYDAAGQELLDFIEIGLANTGITSSQTIPRFTNLSGDAVGVFTSRTSITNVEPLILNTASRDSLREGRFTADLNFN